MDKYKKEGQNVNQTQSSSESQDLQTDMAGVPALLAAATMYLYVGTYTPPDGNGQGIYLYQVDENLDIQLLQTTVTPSPTFLTFSPDKTLLFAVNEISEYNNKATGSVSSYQIDATSRTLTYLNTQESSGAGPAHLSTDPTGKYVMVANYGAGTVGILPVNTDGSLQAPSDSWQDDNSDPNSPPHAHMITYDKDNQKVVLVDLGLDNTFVFQLDTQLGKLNPINVQLANGSSVQSTAPAADGAGPRHIAFAKDGKFAYVINELASTINTFAYDSAAGTFQELQLISSLPPGLVLNVTNSGAEIMIHPDINFLYVSNRGYDSISVFAVDTATGLLTYVDNTSTLGSFPRHFNIDLTGNNLWVGNQKSDNVVVFSIDRTTGKLTYTGKTFSIPTPVCLQFIAP